MVSLPTIKVIVERPEPKSITPPSNLRNDAKGVSEYYFATMTEVNKAYIEAGKQVSAGYMERAKLIQTAAVAIGTLYTGILAFLFVSGDGMKDAPPAQILDSSGIIPTMYFGIAIALSMGFTSFMVPRKDSVRRPLEGLYEADAETQRNAFVDWVTDVRWWRIMLLQLSVVALSLGVAFMPVGLITIEVTVAREWAIALGVGSLIVVLLGWGVYWIGGKAHWHS